MRSQRFLRIPQHSVKYISVEGDLSTCICKLGLEIESHCRIGSGGIKYHVFILSSISHHPLTTIGEAVFGDMSQTDPSPEIVCHKGSKD